MRGLTIHLLGPLYVTLDGKPVTGFGYDKVRALLAYLAAEQARPHRREALAGLLWPDQAEQAAESSLRNALSRLRGVLGDHQAVPSYLVATREVIQFNPGSHHWLDLLRFNELLDTCRTHHHRRIEACLSCTDRLLEASHLYHGEFMQGFCLPYNDLFEDWLRLQRDLLRQQALEALAQLAASYLWRGEPGKALTYTQKQLSLEPCREKAYTQGMKIHAALGQRAEACELYEHCKLQLKQDLDLAPMDETTHLYEQIKYGLYQPASSQAVRLNNLPTNLTSFIGREHELGEIRSLLEDSACRLLSLVGPGGVGKTRLAIAAAAQQLDSFPNGACFVSLVGVSSIEGIPPAILQALGDKSAAGDLEKHLLVYLRDKELVLILDNFEHLLAGASLTTEILQHAPGILLLVTTRQRLGLQAEWVFEVGGLNYPSVKDTRDLASYEAVKLFTQRLHQFKPRHALIQDDLLSAAHICRVVEGLPLGVELAAAAVRHKRIRQVAIDIQSGKDDLKNAWKDVPERHRSIRAVFEHSFKMLNNGEQVAFTGLGVFRSGFTAEAAEQVARATPAIMEALVEHSLVRFDASLGLYTLHELVRQFARDKLREAPEMDFNLRQRHSKYYFQIFAEYRKNLIGPQEAMVLKEMDPHQPDMQAAWDWACQQKDIQALSEGLRSLGEYYFVRQRIREFDQAINQALKTLEQLEPGNLHAMRLEVLLHYAYFECRTVVGNLPMDAELNYRWERCIRLLDELEQSGEDVRHEKVRIVMEMSVWATNLADKFRYIHQSVELARESGEDVSLSISLNNLFSCYFYVGEFLQAETFGQEALVQARKLGDPFHLAGDLAMMSNITAYLGNLEQAVQYADESAKQSFSMGTPVNMLNGFKTLAEVRYYTREWDIASKHYEECLPHAIEAGNRNRLCSLIADWALVKLLAGCYEEAAKMASENNELAAVIDDSTTNRTNDLTLAGSALVREDYLQAISLLEQPVRDPNDLSYPFIAQLMSGMQSIALFSAGRIEAGYSQMVLLVQTGVQRHSYPDLSYALPAVALYLAIKGESERALELYGLVSEKTIYGNTPWLEDVVGKQIKKLAEVLPTDVADLAMERGRKLDLFETGAKLLEEFKN